MEFRLNDLHCHSGLSACSGDPEMTAQKMIENAAKWNYSAICLTDHLWDSAVPGASDWYAPQDIEHVRSVLPLPVPDNGMPFYFGCETELPVCGRPALAKEHFSLFDFIVIPTNHMHMRGLVRPEGIDTPEKMARLMEKRLADLLEQDLPFEKIGLAHLTCSLMFLDGTPEDVVSCMSEARLLEIFKGYAKAGTGIELNAYCFWDLDQRQEEKLLMYRIAREAGCKFYCSSDAHHPGDLTSVPEHLPPVIRALGLTAEDQYVIPGGR